LQVFISFFILSHAFERLVEPPEVHHERLLVNRYVNKTQHFSPN
jgi:Co/Zn/Cd efflux system component